MKRWQQVVLTLVFTGAVTDVFVQRAPDPSSTDESEVRSDELPEMLALRPLAKQLIAREAAAGRRSLFEAAALFRELNRFTPALDVPLLGPYDSRIHLPRETDDEVLCCQVASYVLVALKDRPLGEADAAVARLETEFWEAKLADGVIRLPDRTALPPARELLEQARAALTAAERRALFHPRRVVLER
jgi:hypothetical protein